jgi:hypothetical protein
MPQATVDRHSEEETGVAGPFDVQLPSFVQHLSVLEADV